MKVLIANKYVPLSNANPTHTVEAEYGEICVEGSVETLAHHGPRAGNPAPCLRKNTPATGVRVIGVSHVDLDTMGGIMALQGIKPSFPGFWEAAAAVDVRGIHKLSEITQNPYIVERLNAYWAFSEKNRVFAPRDASVVDVTVQVGDHAEALRKICMGDDDLLKAGREWLGEKAKLAKSSFVQEESGVILRRSDRFTNSLYEHGGEVAKAIVSYNDMAGTITVSLADPVEGISCREVVQGLWGDEAGGHDGIAGSPRGQHMALSDAFAAFEVMVKLF